MPITRLGFLIAITLILTATAFPANARFLAYDQHIAFLQAVNKDITKLLPRAMAQFLYQNQEDFMRGMTFMRRAIMSSPRKLKDFEEVRREAYARLSRDIPYCVEAFKGGEIKLDTSAANLSGRLGIIAASIVMAKLPAVPDLEYLLNVSRTVDAAIAENLIDVWVYYDGYGDFHSLGELMERFQEEGMPEFRHELNKHFPIKMREDPYSMFRAPEKFDQKIVLTDVDVNDIYNDAINCILDAFVYIWKCSGMDLAHPSYVAPPGTVISRPSLRREIRGGILARTVRPPAAAPPEGEAELPEGLEAPEEIGEEEEAPPAPESAPPARVPRAPAAPPPEAEE